MREVRLGVADALDDRDLALVVEGLDPRHAPVEAEAGRPERQRGVGCARQRRAEGPQVRVVHRDDRLKAIGAAGELDHHQHAVVHDAVFLTGVDRAGEDVGHRGVAGRESRGTGREHEAVLHELATRQAGEIGGTHQFNLSLSLEDRTRSSQVNCSSLASFQRHLISVGTRATRRPRTSAIGHRARC